VTRCDARRASRVPPINTKPCRRQLTRQNWPPFAHMGATGATAAAKWYDGGARLPPGARVASWPSAGWWHARTGAGEEVIMSIAGRVSRAMLSRYSHVRIERNGAPSTRSPHASARPTRSARRRPDVRRLRWYPIQRWFSNRPAGKRGSPPLSGPDRSRNKALLLRLVGPS
jgi:hypothetical protein